MLALLAAYVPGHRSHLFIFIRFPLIARGLSEIPHRKPVCYSRGETLLPTPKRVAAGESFRPRLTSKMPRKRKFRFYFRVPRVVPH
jgi:hypothetical protein